MKKMSFLNKIYVFCGFFSGMGMLFNEECRAVPRLPAPPTQAVSAPTQIVPSPASQPTSPSVPEKSLSQQLQETLSDPNYPFRYAAFADGVRTRDRCGREVQMFVASPWVISSGDPRDAQSGLCPSCPCAVVAQPAQPSCASSIVYAVKKQPENRKPCMTYSFVQQTTPRCVA